MAKVLMHLPVTDRCAVRATCKSWARCVNANLVYLQPYTQPRDLRAFEKLRSLDLLEMDPDDAAALHLSSCPPHVRHVVLRPDTAARFFEAWDGPAQPTASLEHVFITPVPGEAPFTEPLRLCTLPATLTALRLEHCAPCLWDQPPLRMLPLERLSNLTHLSLRGTLRPHTPDGEDILRGLEELTQLRVLNLAHNTFCLSNDSLHLVAVCCSATLTTLDLTAIGTLNQESLRRLRPLQHLTALLMADTPWIDHNLHGLRELGHFPRLQRLSLPDLRFVVAHRGEARSVWSTVATKLRDLRELQMDSRLYLSTLDLRTDEELPPATSVIQVTVLWRSGTKRWFRWFSSSRLFPALRAVRLHRVERLSVDTVLGLQMLAMDADVTVTVLGSDDDDCTQRLFEQSPFPWPGAQAPLDLDMRATIVV